jgi:hypothetical protein
VRQYAPKSPELLDHVGRVLITRHGIQLKVMSHGLYILQLLYWVYNSLTFFLRLRVTPILTRSVTIIMI